MSLERGRYYAILGSLVLRERTRQKLTQAQLGEKLGVDQSTVARIERGKLSVKLDLARTIASELFGISFAALDSRIISVNKRVARADRAVGGTKMQSRDAARHLIEYVLSVGA